MSFIKELSLSVGMSEFDISRIVATAPHRYKMYSIPKRDGIGTRIIAQPARELKILQRYVVGIVLKDLPVHPCATAYTEGKSIRDNALPHADSRVIMKLDFKDFFHSLIFKDLQKVFESENFIRVSRHEWGYLENILFWANPWKRGKKCLSIGAPSSPMLSNLIMENLDREFILCCKKNSVIYTRYADDITMSSATAESLLDTEKDIRAIVRKTRRPKLAFNESKRGIFTLAGRRLITGLVITPDKKISIGRGRKREVSAAVHHIVVGKNVTIEHISITKGWLAYAQSVEPVFFEAMVQKYGNAVRQIMATRTPLRPKVIPRKKPI